MECPPNGTLYLAIGVIEYLNNNLFKVEHNSFVALESFDSGKKEEEKRYNENIYYWEIQT